MTTWWKGIPATTMTISCAGSEHRLRWQDGILAALDHADPEGERALTALGGEPMACIQFLDSWSRHTEDLDVLLLASRGPADPLPRTDDTPRGSMAFMSPTAYAAMRSTGGWTSPFPMNSPVEDADDVSSLLKLTSGLPQRLVATVLATWTQRLTARDHTASPALHAALYGRVAAALAGWLPEPSLDVQLTMLPAGGVPTAVRDQHTVHIALPFSWLSEVWVRGFATVAGRFCLAASLSTSGSWTLTAIAPDFADPTPITLTIGPPLQHSPSPGG